LLERGPDLGGETARLGRLLRGVRDLLEQHGQALQREGQEMVAGDVVPQLAGIVRGAEPGPHEAVRRGQGAAPLAVEGVLRGNARALEAVLRALLMML